MIGTILLVVLGVVVVGVVAIYFYKNNTKKVDADLTEAEAAAKKAKDEAEALLKKKS